MLRSALFVALLSACSLTAAQAGDPCYGGGAGWGYMPQYRFYSTESVPYFSLHPPVYYSYPVPRTYGYSPFAYPPGVMTPDCPPSAGEPQTMINPFVPQKADPVSSERTAQRIKVIHNPFINGGHAGDELTLVARRK